MKSIQFTIATLTLLISTFLVATPGQAESGSQVLVRGKISNVAGVAVAKATITVFAEPVSSSPRKEGQTTHMEVLGSATSDANGAYNLYADQAIDLSEFADKSGVLHLNIFAENGSLAATSAVQSRITFPNSGAEAQTNGPVSSNLKLEGLKGSNSRASASASPARGGGGHSQTATVVKDYGGRNTIIGAWTSDTKYVSHSFTYANSASSKLGVAVSGTGKAGSFKESRTKSISAKGSINMGKQKGKGSWRFYTQFHYQNKHYKTCGGFMCINEYRIEPVSWRGGGTVTKSSKFAYSAKNCVPMSKGNTWSKTSTDAWVFSKGVSTNGMLGVSLTSQSGYSNAVKQSITFSRDGELCGKSAFPGKAPRALRAKSK